jgi:type II secretory pathway pseudopilin PulG
MPVRSISTWRVSQPAATTKSRAVRRFAFTLVEAMVSLAILSIAGSAILLTTTSSLQTTTEAVHRTMAIGLARQLMDEIAGCRYADPLNPAEPYPLLLGPGAWEQLGKGRERYNDIGDYNQYSARPPQDPRGIPLGLDDGQGGQRHSSVCITASRLSRWEQSVQVYYVDDNDPSVRLPLGQTSNHRAVEVAIYFHDSQRGRLEMSRMRRVFAYVPTR